ncbi:MAG: HD domain-containing protein [Candidatus Cloacimonetes bacterium]|nr:HD domain-containing protein [Candidatus Cloacimonadota bacterium]
MKYEFSENMAINTMLNQVISSITELAENQVTHISNLTKIGQSLSSETDLNKIFDMILEEAIHFTNADGATIYVVSEDGRKLAFEIVYTGSLGLRMGGSHGTVNWPAIDLYDAEGKPRLNHIVTSVYHTKQCVCFEDVYETKEYDISGTIKTDKANNYRCKSMLTIPLKNHEDEVLGVIQVINAMDKEGQISSFSEEHQTMLYSLASQAAIALSNRKLIAGLENLLMEFIKAIGSAIGKKSKYTFDHIDRVANMTDMIAARINECKEGKFADFRFSDNELKELSMAGWLHDVGKITTPEAIMDKSVKLEKIVDRIQIVEQRFETFKLLLMHLMHILSPQEFDILIKGRISEDLDKDSYLEFLDKELEFLKLVNFGGEFLPDADVQRIERLAGIGIEHEGKHYFLIDENEKKNLQIQRGTFLPEEMSIMSAHVSVTWDMLSQLTFPKKFKDVAFYAATHHEKLNGKGYPRGLGAEELPLQSRIIAIADILEALTSADRPYKKPKTLSESLKIMAFMVKDSHLDADLMDFLLDSGLYLDFANRFMNKDYIDQVNIQMLKSFYHPAQ